jgi:hypothetical protein
MRQAQIHRMRRIIRELIDMLPEEQKNSPRVRSSLAGVVQRPCTLWRLMLSQSRGRTISAISTFHRAAVQARWRAGYVDAMSHVRATAMG